MLRRRLPISVTSAESVLTVSMSEPMEVASFSSIPARTPNGAEPHARIGKLVLKGVTASAGHIGFASLCDSTAFQVVPGTHTFQVQEVWGSHYSKAAEEMVFPDLDYSYRLTIWTPESRFTYTIHPIADLHRLLQHRSSTHTLITQMNVLGALNELSN